MTGPFRKQPKTVNRMTVEELREATREFDEPFVALEKSRPLSRAQKEQHRQAKRCWPGRPKAAAARRRSAPRKG